MRPHTTRTEAFRRLLGRLLYLECRTMRSWALVWCPNVATVTVYQWVEGYYPPPEWWCDLVELYLWSLGGVNRLAQVELAVKRKGGMNGCPNRV